MRTRGVGVIGAERTDDFDLLFDFYAISLVVVLEGVDIRNYIMVAFIATSHALSSSLQTRK
jgi:hypothetical protein